MEVNEEAEMSSRKRSARKREQAAIKAELRNDGWTNDLFEREAAREATDAERRDQALRAKACESKARYGSRAEAKATIASCERHGSPALYLYRCPYCGGWHLTHKRPKK